MINYHQVNIQIITKKVKRSRRTRRDIFPSFNLIVPRGTSFSILAALSAQCPSSIWCDCLLFMSVQKKMRKMKINFWECLSKGVLFNITEVSGNVFFARRTCNILLLAFAQD